MTHNQLQQKCWQHLWNEFPQSRFRSWHTSNEEVPFPSESRKQHMIRLSQKKAIGSLKGVWDLVLYHQNVLHIFEIKVGRDKLSDDQIRFKNAIESEGGKSYIIHELSMFAEIVEKIFNG